MPPTNPFDQIKDLLFKLLEPIEKKLGGVMTVVYGALDDRKDTGIQGEINKVTDLLEANPNITEDVKKNNEFRVSTLKFRKWLIASIIIFILTTLANVGMFILNLLSKL